MCCVEKFRFPVWFPLTLVLLSTGCGSATSPTVDGVYLLARIDGQALPTDVGPMPPKNGVQSPCRMIVYEGSLSMDSSTKTFAWVYRTRDSCDIGIFPETATHGSYTLTGSVITFTVQSGPGSYSTYTGARLDKRVLLSDDHYELDFRR